MSLRTKILIGFGGVLALVVVVWFWAILQLYRLGNASQAILQDNYQSILAAQNMLGSLERQDSAMLLQLLGYEVNGVEQFRTNEVAFLQWLSRAQDNITIEREEELVQSIQDEYAQYLIVASQAALAEQAYYDTVLPQFQLVRTQIETLRELNEDAMAQASVQAQRQAQQTIWSTIAVGVVISALGLGLSLWFSGFLARPLQEMSAAATEIAEGNYDVSLSTAASHDELGRLAQDIMLMSNQLKAFHHLNVGRILAEKRRSEAIIRSIADSLVVVDEEGTVIALNTEAARIFGTVPAQAQGEHFSDVVHDLALHEYVRAALHSGRAPQIGEDALFSVERDGKVANYRVSVTPVEGGRHQLLGAVLLLQDVTKFTELDRLKDDFVMTASHELRTPLTSMAMSLGLLAESAEAKLTDHERELLATAEQETLNLRSLVSDLLDLSQIESGHMHMENETVAPRQLVEHAVSLFTEQAQDKEIELAYHVPESVCPVWADPNKIAWVLSNLIGNALRYTESGCHIDVSVAQGNHIALFSVADTGSGIPLEYQTRIFEKFVRIDKDQSVGGTGLGLAICKEIVKAHGGSIWVESEVAKGSTFYFTLRCAVPDAIQTGENQDGLEETAHSGR